MKSNIRRHVLKPVLFLSVLAFVILADVLVVGTLSIHYNLNEKITDYSTSYAQNFNVVQDIGKISLEKLAKNKAKYIDKELVDMKWDTKFLAELMNRYLTLPPSDISKRNISNPMYQKIQSGEPYINYSPTLKARGINDALQAEINRAGNISDVLIPFGKRYNGYDSGFFVASKNGYYIAMETTADGSNVIFADDYFLNYDFQKRPWYVKGKDAKEPTFTEVFADMNGTLSVSCVTSYVDGNGEFAGVVSIAYGIPYIYQVVVDTAVGADGFSFILDSNGDVIVSGKDEGIFASTKEYFDLRTADDAAISETAKRMTAGESGVTSITFDGEEYYVAFAPMPASGWSFATLTSRANLTAPAVAARNTMHNKINDLDFVYLQSD